jgi:iron-sulfur cluster insertion protein
MNLQITDNAVLKIRDMILKDIRNVWPEPYLYFRIYVESGGCTGLQYGFRLDEEINEDDTVVEHQGIKVVVDSQSYSHLEGSTVDYESKLFSSNFVITNPNATAKCGCGSSFSV